jgi:hypothetical protein
MSYDLARLRRNGLVERLPDSNTYVLTDEGTARRDLLRNGQTLKYGGDGRESNPPATDAAAHRF